jgi:NFU1 iron-sulfur cluster scaffold homolog, mitochondrial
MKDPARASDLGAEVAAVLERSILPSVIARGATIRVISAADGVVILETGGSPGAVLPVLSRIETQVRSAVPDVIAVRLAAAPSPPSAEASDLSSEAQRILDAEVNPAVTAHRGHIAVDSAGGGWVRIRLEGSCQGCSLAEVTVRQGIEPLLRARLPGITGVADVTDHEAGTDPFFSPEKR